MLCCLADFTQETCVSVFISAASVPEGSVVPNALKQSHGPSSTTPRAQHMVCTQRSRTHSYTPEASALIMEVQGPGFVPTKHSLGCSQPQRYCLPFHGSLEAVGVCKVSQ